MTHGQQHERAIDLITRRGVEGINRAETSWLECHLGECPQCASYAASVTAAAQLLRFRPVSASATLVSSTQARLRARALELRERQARTFLIGISFCLGVMSSAVSAWLWWKFGGLVAARLHLPSAIVEPGLLIVWMLPALVFAIVVMASSHPVIDRSVTLALLGEREGGHQ